MPSVICEGCGSLTNSATSDYWLNLDFETQIYYATECYIRWENDIIKKGCRYEHASVFYHTLYKRLSKGQMN